MKNLYKILAIILISVTMLATSCKKDEQIIEGCTDSSAMNYLSNATSNNGSCIYAYNIAQGTWNLYPDCEEYDVLDLGVYIISLNEELPESIDVEGAGNNELYIDISGEQVNGAIDFDGNITVYKQTIDVDMGFGPISLDIEGDGVIYSEISGIMNLKYSFSDIQISNLPIPLPLPISGEIDCAITLDK